MVYFLRGPGVSWTARLETNQYWGLSTVLRRGRSRGGPVSAGGSWRLVMCRGRRWRRRQRTSSRRGGAMMGLSPFLLVCRKTLLSTVRVASVTGRITAAAATAARVRRRVGSHTWAPRHIHTFSQSGKRWLFALEYLKPLPGQLGSATPRLMPHHREVGGGAEVLCDGDGGVHVEHYVPPAAGHKHCLARTLQHLHGFILLRPVWSLRAGIHEPEPSDGLVRLLATLTAAHLQQLLGSGGGEHTPPLMAL